MIAGQNFRIPDGRFFFRRKQIAGSVIGNCRNFFFRQSFLSCDRKTGVKSEKTVVFGGDHHAHEFSNLAVDRATRFQHELEVVINK